VTCLTLVGHLLYRCHVNGARFIQLKGVELMVELSGAECPEYVSQQAAKILSYLLVLTLVLIVPCRWLI